MTNKVLAEHVATAEYDRGTMMTVLSAGMARCVANQVSLSGDDAHESGPTATHYMFAQQLYVDAVDGNCELVGAWPERMEGGATLPAECLIRLATGGAVRITHSTGLFGCRIERYETYDDPATIMQAAPKGSVSVHRDAEGGEIASVFVDRHGAAHLLELYPSHIRSLAQLFEDLAGLSA
jgi:hypothetical protein